MTTEQTTDAPKTPAPAEATLEEIRQKVAAGTPLVGSTATSFQRAVVAADPFATEETLLTLTAVRGAHLYETLVSWAPFVAGERVLDVGCGAGGAAFTAAEVVGPTGFVAGVDVVPEAVRAAEARIPAGAPMVFRVGRAESMTAFEDKSFDGVIASLVLDWIDDLRQPLEEVARLLRPGGRFVASVMAFDRLRPADAEFMGQVLAVIGRNAPGALAGRASRASIPDEPDDALAFKEAGFLTPEELDVTLGAVMERPEDAWPLFSRSLLGAILDEKGQEDLRNTLAELMPHTLYIPVRFLRTRRPG